MGANASVARPVEQQGARSGYAIGQLPSYTSSGDESWYTKRNPNQGNSLGRSKSLGANGHYPLSPSGSYLGQFGTLSGYPQYAPFAYSPAYAGMPAMHILPGTTISSSSQTPTPTRVNYPVTSHVQTPVPIPPAPIPTPIVRPHEVPVAPTIVPIPDVPPLGDTSMSSDTTDDTPTSTSDSSGTASGSTDSTEINTPADDPLTSNPLPEPPKESSIPEHLISSTSVTQHTPNISDSPTSSANAHAQPPLERPLPELPRDVYDTPQYRVLTMGNGYHHAIHPSRIYPEGWFDEVGQKKEKESRKGKEKEGGKENRVHHRSASAIVSSPIQPTSMANLAPTRAPASGSSLTRKFTKTMKRIVRGSTFRRGPRPPTTPMPTPAAFPGSPGTSSISYAHPVNVQSGLPAVAVATNPTAYTSYTLSSLGPIGSPSASSSGGMPVIPGVTTPAPLPATSSTTVSPSMNSNATTTTVTVTSHASLLGQIPTSLTNPLSPGVQLYQPRPFVFDHTNPFSLSSRYAILYRKKLYPSALHLLEAHRFLGIRDEFAERIRSTQNIDDLHVLVAELAPYRRRDWDGVVISRLEDVLYLKFVQHSDLRRWLLDTGIADLYYQDGNDTFWGIDSSGRGLNELGKSLVRVRDRLRREGAGR